MQRSGCLTPGKYPVPIEYEVGWALGPVWTGAENLDPNGIRSPDRPARSESLYRPTLVSYIYIHIYIRVCVCVCVCVCVYVHLGTLVWELQTHEWAQRHALAAYPLG
jgi:hypothetical protein